MVVVMLSFIVSRLRRSGPEPDPLLYHLRSDAEQHRKQTLQAIYNSTDVECLSMLRMARALFYALCNLFRNRGLVPENARCTIEEQVAMFLRVVGHNQRFRVVHQSLRRSIETVHRHFHQVLYALGELRSEMIKPPTPGIHSKILGSQR
jgi:predicted chitinase